MDKEAKSIASQIARQLYAMVSKKKDADLSVAMQNARYQRTFTDDYPFARKPRAREPVPKEVQEGWKRLAAKQGDT